MHALAEKLLALPDPNSEEGLTFDYAALSANEEDVETMLRFLANSDELEELEDDQWDHVQVYSYRSLGERGEMRFFDTFIDAYAGYLGSQHTTRVLNGFVASSLAELDAAQHAPVIREIYQANLIDVTMLGDLEEAEIVLGVRETRSTPKPHFGELERTLIQQARRAELGPLPDTGDHLAVLNYFLYLHQTPRSMISVSQLDGFLLACRCAPQIIPPSVYMPRIWDREGGPDSGPA